MRYLIVLLFIPLFSFAEVNLPLQQQLLDMGNKDQEIRNEIGAAGWGNAPKELLEKLNKIDHSNTERLKAIIKKYSWLTKELVGV
nr:DUF6624 domain-containing protein [Shewanella piezotolerans]